LTYNIRDKVFKIAEKLFILDFKAIISWLMGFKRKKPFLFRKKTFFDQQDNRRPQEIKKTVPNYF
jgi:hypothetical protein